VTAYEPPNPNGDVGAADVVEVTRWITALTVTSRFAQDYLGLLMVVAAAA